MAGRRRAAAAARSAPIRSPPRHLNARDTTLAYVSRAPQENIQGLKERMGWEQIPWYSITDDFDTDHDVEEWHGHNIFVRDDEGNVFRTYFIDERADEHMGTTGATSI